MISSNTCTKGSLSLSTVIRDEYMMTTVNGTEAYSLVDKESGRVTLAAFESRVAANRFFAENKSYYATKIM